MEQIITSCVGAAAGSSARLGIVTMIHAHTRMACIDHLSGSGPAFNIMRINLFIIDL
jgi:hypothetical protein